MSPARLEPGLRATEEHVVGFEDTAAALGSGSLPVLGTPRLLAWCESATCAALASTLSEAETSVGTRVNLEHTAPCAVGTAVEVAADLVHVDGRLVRFSVAARQDGKLVGSGEITRVVVDTERFLSRVPAAD
ncbi:MAG: hotdog domain-containing protein [Candidatus Limnocylindrales bacterium]